MDILQIVSLASLVLMLISLVFTIIQIINKIQLRKYKGLFVDEIITYMEENKTKEQIFAILKAEEYSEELINSKYEEIGELMSIRS